MRGLAGGSPPKTLQALKRSGTYRPHRHEKLTDDSELEPIKEAPEWLDEDEKQQFNVLLERKKPETYPVGDTEALALMAHMQVKLMRRELKMTEVTTFRLLSREFGFTPDSRLRMPLAQKPEEVDPFDELVKRRKAQEVA